MLLLFCFCFFLQQPAMLYYHMLATFWCLFLSSFLTFILSVPSPSSLTWLVFSRMVPGPAQGFLKFSLVTGLIWGFRLWFLPL